MHAQSAVWAWGTSMYLDIKFHQYVTYVLAGCLENIFWNYRKLGFFVRSNCYPCATVVRWIVCCVNTLCLSALPLFVHYPQGMCSDALTLPPMQALSSVSMLPKPLRYMTWVSLEHPGRPLYYCVRTSATVQPTKSMQCNHTVEAEVWYR